MYYGYKYMFLLCFVYQVQDGRWKPFLVKPLPSQLMKPLLVFVNPKSGGNQVSPGPLSTQSFFNFKMHKFCYAADPV